MAQKSSASLRLGQVESHLQKPPFVFEPLLLDHVVIITGAAQGIGKSTAELFAHHGANLVLSDIDLPRLQALQDQLSSKATEVLISQGNVLDEAYPDTLITAALARFGKINCLINNAGFLQDSAIHKMSDEQFDVVMKVHNYAPFRMVRALSKHWMSPEMHEQPKSIINIASTSGLHGSMGQANYSTAKAGITGLTKTIAAEWARYNVRCNCVAPGWIDTRITRPPDPKVQLELKTTATSTLKISPGVPLSSKKFRDTSDIPLGRPGMASEVSNCMLFMASGMASYVTGAVLECTGGRYM